MPLAEIGRLLDFVTHPEADCGDINRLIDEQLARMRAQLTSLRALFAWLLTLHPFAAGRTYAAYGGVYVAVALGWLWVVDGVTPTRWDAIGAGVALVGMAIIALQPRSV